MLSNELNSELFLVDSHCHLDLEQFAADRDAVVARARAAGLRLIVNPGIDLHHSRQAIAMAEQYPEVYAAVGIHPNSSGDFQPTMLNELRTLAAHPKVVAIGEIGLDYYWKLVEPAQQAIAFQAQLELAAELGLPVIIHCREANEQTATTLRNWVQSAALLASPLATRSFWGILHAFPGDWAMAQEAYSWNFILGLGGPVTYKNAKSLQELVPHLRLDRLLLETDAPYLTPHPHRGERNEPAYVKLVCEQLAQLYATTSAHIGPAHIGVMTSTLAYRFFGLKSDELAFAEPKRLG